MGLTRKGTYNRQQALHCVLLLTYRDSLMWFHIIFLETYWFIIFHDVDPIG